MFRLASRLKVNIAKSKITEVGVPSSEVESLASSLGCSHESLPFSYLRLLVGKRLRTCSGWSDIINRFRDRLSSWKAKSLSIGGRLTLVKFVLGSIPIYYLSLFKSPLKVVSILESIRGGSGFGSLLDKNMSLIRKWKWRFLVENNALWRMVIKDFYGIDGGFGSPHNSFGSRVSNGSVTSFYADPWCPNGLILKYTFPKLFALETYKDSKRAIDDLSTIEGLISSLVRESDGEDKWVWKGDASKSFKAKFLSISIQKLLLANDIIDSHCLWNSWIPRKVNICLWRASLDRLLTRTNLSYHGVVLPSLSCPLCSNAL
ncbi:reverse transcriptase domain, reverse transcriptase zinc-binding domain protein [Tanacetum coccineum]